MENIFTLDYVFTLPEATQGYGIYFLIKEDIIVYIGKTRNLKSRLMDHYSKDYDVVRLYKCGAKARDTMEVSFIKNFLPPLNITHNSLHSSGKKIIHISNNWIYTNVFYGNHPGQLVNLKIVEGQVNFKNEPVGFISEGYLHLFKISFDGGTYPKPFKYKLPELDKPSEPIKTDKRTPSFKVEISPFLQKYSNRKF